MIVTAPGGEARLDDGRAGLLRSNALKLLVALGVAACIMLVLLAPNAFATGSVNMKQYDSFITKVTQVLQQFYKSSRVVVTVLAAVLLAIAFVVRMTAGQQKAQQATSWIARILIAYVGFMVAGVIVSIVNQVATGNLGVIQSAPKS